MKLDRRWIITGFGPFGPVVHNPSADVARSVARSLDAPSEVRVLSVTYRSVADFARKIAGLDQATFIIGFGYSSRINGVQIEPLANNTIISSFPDASGEVLKGDRIVPSDPRETIRADQAFVELLQEQLSLEKVEVRLAEFPSGYVCNAYLYSLLSYCRPDLGPRAMFCHVGPMQQSEAAELGPRFARALEQVTDRLASGSSAEF